MIRSYLTTHTPLEEVWQGLVLYPGGQEEGQLLVGGGRPPLQTGEGPRHPDFCTQCGQWRSQNLAQPCGRDGLGIHQGLGYLLSWHPAGPYFPAASHLAWAL